MVTHLTTFTHVIDEGELGPKMRALQPKQQAFVMALLVNGDDNASRAARDAGYSPAANVVNVTAHRLMHDARIQEAIQEESVRRLNSASILAVSELVKIAGNPAHKSQTKAIEMILNRTGLHAKSEHKVSVEHMMGDDELRDKIKHLAEKHGIDLSAYTGQTLIDVTPEGSTEGLEDLLG